MGPPIRLVLLALLGSALWAPSAWAYSCCYHRGDDPPGLELTGYLVWDGGKGSISWSAPGVADDGGPGADASGDVWVSEPLPFGMYLNATRLIQVDVFTKDLPSDKNRGTTCSRFGTSTGRRSELWLGGNFLGSSPFDQGFRDPEVPPDPPGYGVCRMRVQPELPYLPAAAVLTLRIHHQGNVDPAYGLRGDHASVIRLSYYSEDELPYRFPGYVHGSPGPLPSSSSAVNEVTSILGFGAVAAGLLAAPRRSRAAALVLVLLAAGLAGCLGGGRPQPTALDASGRIPTGEVQSSYQKGESTVPGKGSLAGQVTAEDTGRPVPGAIALLLGASNSSTTDPYGRFVFRNLAPGAYTLRIDHAEYHAFEVRVTIFADLITRANFTLVPLIAGDPAQRAHAHDYWGDAEEIVLLENHDLGVLPEGCGTALTGPCQPIQMFGIPPDSKKFHAVLPGTYEVNVTIDWDVELLGFRNVTLHFQANHDASFYNWTGMGPRGPRQSFHIVTNWEMADSGHQKFSTWLFSILTSDPVPGRSSDLTDPNTWVQYAQQYFQTEFASFQVTVKIRKGIVPLEPAHPDLWKGLDTAFVVKDSAQGATNLLFDYQPWDLSWLPEDLVPPETVWLEVYANTSRDLLPEYDFELRYRTARTGAPHVDCWFSASRTTCNGPDYTIAAGATRTGRSTRWTIEPGPDDPDPFYASRSFWVFGLRPAPDPANTALNALDNRQGTNGLEMRLTVIAHRDPMPT